jgi:hypothetical protein
MKGLRHSILAVTALLLATVGSAEKANTKPVLRLVLDLTDGSRIIGVPSIQSIPVQTSYAKMDIPLKRILSIRIDDDHETASFELQDRDKVKGVPKLSPVVLDTVFGRVSIGLEHVTKIEVLRGSLSGRPVLHYSFDRDEGGRVIDQSGHGHDGTAHGLKYEEAVRGQGIRTSSRGTYVICDSPALSCNGWRQLTVSAWVKLSRHTTYGHVVNRGKEGKSGAFGISVGGVYGAKPYDCGFSVRLGEKKSARVGVKRFADLKQWYHVAGVYDGRTVKYYVNGAEIGSADVPAELRNARIKEDKGVALVIGKSAGRPSWSDTHINGVIDEVMLFDHALTEGQIRHAYNARR